MDANEADAPLPGRTPRDAVTLAQWDATLQQLWSPTLSTALAAADALYAPNTGAESVLPEHTAMVCREFWRHLTQRQKQMPSTPETRFYAVEMVVGRILRTVRESPHAAHFIEEYLAIALRPVRALRLGALTPEVCAALYDYYRGVWTPHLTKPQLHLLQTALAQTLAALPPDQMQAFWDGLQSEDPMRRRAMLLGLEFLRSAHAVPHLLRGLEQSRDHGVRSLLVENLEVIADPTALPTLIRLRRDTAHSDWTLSRLIARAIRVIEHQNAGRHHRTLLRAATSPPDPDESLLRPAADALDPNTDRTTLMRPDPGEHGERKEPPD